MTIIGEKINGAVPSAAKAIASFDEGFIRGLARRQAEAGADYLDICTGGSTDRELDVMGWLIDVVQDTVDLPLCIDSPNARVIEAVMPRLKKPGIINSVSGEGNKCEALFPLMQDNEWQVIALTCDDNGIPCDEKGKVAIADTLITKADRYGISAERMYIDPVVMALSAFNDAFSTFANAIRGIKGLHPKVMTTSGLSNISFGMPSRKLINLHFLTLALSVGMDSAILDPTNRDTIATILSTEALLGRDRYCRRYNTAYREGRIGVKKQESAPIASKTK